jgi:hypothetical protein
LFGLFKKEKVNSGTHLGRGLVVWYWLILFHCIASFNRLQTRL